MSRNVDIYRPLSKKEMQEIFDKIEYKSVNKEVVIWCNSKNVDKIEAMWKDALMGFAKHYGHTIKENNMKQKVIVYNYNMDSSMYFNTYEDAAKFLDCKVDKLKRVADTNEKISNVYLIRRSN